MWQTSNLTDLASVSTGKWDANHSVENGRYRFYTCAATHLYSDTKRFSGECLILPGNGANVGDVYFYEGDFDAYQRTYVIHDIQILPKFFHYHLLSNWRDINANKQFGSATNFIKIGNFKDYKVSYPPLPEQQRIVAKLDAAFAEIDNAIELAKVKEAEVDNLKSALLSSFLNDDGVMWETVNLSDVCNLVAGGTPNSKEKSYWGEDIQWLTPKDMGKLNSRDVSETERQITSKGLSNSSAKLVPENSVILSCRAPIGYVAINKVPMSFNQGCKGLTPKNNITAQFLYYFLLLSKDLLNELGTGTTFKEISTKALSNIEISIPPLAEQQHIVAKLDAAFAEIAVAKDAVVAYQQNYQTLKSAILAQELQREAA